MRTLIAAFAGSMLLAGAAQAQNCSLDEIASLPVTTLSSGAIAAPFGIDGRSVLLAVALQSPRSGLTGGAGPHAVAIGSITLDGENIGAATGVPAGASGVIGMDLLHRFGVELDMAHARLLLFAHPQCPGPGVVHWTNQYTVVPMHIDASGHVVAQLTLDGKPANVEVSTAPGHLAMRAPGDVKALGIGAISLANPEVVAANDIPADADARIGLDELKKLHLFFAFSEGKLYVTP